MRWALVPVMTAWAARTGASLGHVPRPTDAPQARSAGVDSDRVLVFGSGPAVGWGVLSHDLALPGSLARALSARTGRGVDVEALFSPQTTARSAVADLDDRELGRYDAIVVTLGGNDALTLTSVRAWRRELSAFLRLLVRTSGRSTQVFMLGVQPIRSVPGFGGPFGTIADRHAAVLNEATAVMCRALPRTTFVPLTARPGVAADRFRTAEDYRHWAGILAATMAGPLDAEHARGARPAADSAGADRDR